MEILLETNLLGTLDRKDPRLEDWLRPVEDLEESEPGLDLDSDTAAPYQEFGIHSLDLLGLWNPDFP